MLSASQLVSNIEYRYELPSNTNQLDWANILSSPSNYESIEASGNFQACTLTEVVEVPAATGVVCAAEDVDGNSKIYNKVTWLPSQAAMIIEKTIIGILKAIYCIVVIMITLHLEMMSIRLNILSILMQFLV